MAEYSHLNRESLERLDSLVSEYLLFRSYKQTQAQLFMDKRSPTKRSETDARNARNQIMRFLSALDGGDYPRMVTLWDTYVGSKIGTVKSTALNAEARDAEFIVNLCCAIYPFRAEVIENAGSSGVAAKVAARSMIIYKHFLETRGARLVQPGQEFEVYRKLHKIPFPPQHPLFSHLFTDEWYDQARERVIAFLEKFFAPNDEPVLCSLYAKLGSRSEDDLKAVFRRRERKLLRFARSLYSLSNDLLGALEDGKEVNRSFLASFREKFDSFQEVLQPDAVFDQDMGLESEVPSPPRGGPRSSKKEDKEEDWSALGAKSRQRFDGKLLDYNSVSRDVAFLLHQVGMSIDGLLTQGHGISIGDAVVYCHTAMQGTVLLQALTQSILRRDKEMQPTAAMNMAVLVLCRADVLGLRQSTDGELSLADQSYDSNVRVESRSASKFLFYLARCAKRIPPYDPRVREDSEVDKDDSDGEGGPESPPRQRLPAYERLLTAGEVVAEYLCRLVVAMGCSKPGRLYFSSSGVHLTIALTQLLIALPLPDFTGTAELDIYSLGGEDAEGNIPVRPRSGNGICSWCLMALVTLVSQTKAHQLAVLRNGGVTWLAKALGHFVSDTYDELRQEDGTFPASLRPYPSSSESQGPEKSGTENAPTSSLFEMCLLLLTVVLDSEDAQHSLVSTNAMQRETEGMVGALLLLCMKSGVREDHAAVLIRMLKRLFKEVTTKDAARALPEAAVLRQAVEEGTILAFREEQARSLLAILESDGVYEGDASLGEGELDDSENMDLVRTMQMQLDENIILQRYINGAVSGISFLMRYSKKDGAPRPLFDERFEPEERYFNDSQVALDSPRVPFKPKEKRAKPPPELKSRPRILRTPDGSSIPSKGDHGMDMGNGMNDDEEEDEDDMRDIDTGGEELVEEEGGEDEEEDEEDEEEEDEEDEEEEEGEED